MLDLLSPPLHTELATLVVILDWLPLPLRDVFHQPVHMQGLWVREVKAHVQVYLEPLVQP